MFCVLLCNSQVQSQEKMQEKLGKEQNLLCSLVLEMGGMSCHAGPRGEDTREVRSEGKAKASTFTGFSVGEKGKTTG